MRYAYTGFAAMGLMGCALALPQGIPQGPPGPPPSGAPTPTGPPPTDAPKPTGGVEERGFDLPIPVFSGIESLPFTITPPSGNEKRAEPTATPSGPPPWGFPALNGPHGAPPTNLPKPSDFADSDNEKRQLGDLPFSLPTVPFSIPTGLPTGLPFGKREEDLSLPTDLPFPIPTGLSLPHFGEHGGQDKPTPTGPPPSGLPVPSGFEKRQLGDLPFSFPSFPSDSPFHLPTGLPLERRERSLPDITPEGFPDNLPTNLPTPTGPPPSGVPSGFPAPPQ